MQREGEVDRVHALSQDPGSREEPTEKQLQELLSPGAQSHWASRPHSVLALQTGPPRPPRAASMQSEGGLPWGAQVKVSLLR